MKINEVYKIKKESAIKEPLKSEFVILEQFRFNIIYNDSSDRFIWPISGMIWDEDENQMVYAPFGSYYVSEKDVPEFLESYELVIESDDRDSLVKFINAGEVLVRTLKL